MTFNPLFLISRPFNYYGFYFFYLVIVRFNVLLISSFLQFSKDHMSKDKKLSKMMGLGCIIRSGTVFRNTPLLMRIVSEILLNRVGSDRDDMDVFFLLSSLQHVSKLLVSYYASPSSGDAYYS